MKTVLQSHQSDSEEKKSQFLAFLVPYVDFNDQLNQLRLEHTKANHHVTAFRYFDTEKRLHEGSKDDGEPSGCAGVPALKVLQGNDLVNIGIIIVRYFGGIKLGTGGMARAYGSAAKKVVEKAPLVDFFHQGTAVLSANFERISDLERLLSDIDILDRTYSETGIEITITGAEEKIKALKAEWDIVNY